MEDELRIVEPDGLRTQELRCPVTNECRARIQTMLVLQVEGQHGGGEDGRHECVGETIALLRELCHLACGQRVAKHHDAIGDVPPPLLLADFARHLCRPVDGRHAARTISKVVPGPPHGSLHKRRADGQQESYHGGALPTRAGRHGQ